MDRGEWQYLTGGLVLAAGLAAGVFWVLLAQAGQVCSGPLGPWTGGCSWVVPVRLGLAVVAPCAVVGGGWLLGSGARFRAAGR